MQIRLYKSYYIYIHIDICICIYIHVYIFIIEYLKLVRGRLNKERGSKYHQIIFYENCKNNIFFKRKIIEDMKSGRG